MPFRPIRHKVILAFLAVTVLTMSVSLMYFRLFTQEMALERYQEQLRPLRSALQNNLQTYIDTCVGAVHSVYFNEATIESIARTSSNFANAETADSKSIFSFLLSVYASLPATKQIRLAAYRPQRSFLLTTADMRRYLEARPNVTFADEYPDRVDRASTNWVEGSHVLHSYSHFTSPYTPRGGYVFTVHVPIFQLPNATSPIGLISVDISTDYISANCGYISQMGADVYVSDQDGRLIYAMDETLIGKNLQEITGISVLEEGAFSHPDSFIENGALITTDRLDLSCCQWQVNTITPMYRITRDFTSLQQQLLLSFILTLFLLAVITFVITLRFTKPLNQIALFLHANFYGSNYNLKARLGESLDYTSNDEIRFLMESVDSMLDTVNRFVVRQYQLLAARRTADLRTLQAQINPHFIYNTLQCIATKTLEKGDVDSYNYIASFGQMLQYAMDVDEQLVSVEREIGHSRRYLELQSMRFECCVRFDEEVPPDLSHIMLPKMSLQPLIENSFLHGQLSRKKNARILFQAYRSGEEIALEIRDNGVAVSREQERMQDEKVQQLRRQYQYLKQANAEELAQENLLSIGLQPEDNAENEAHHGVHIGASNVFSRFLLQFGSRCQFSMRANDWGGTTIRILIPGDRIIHAPVNPEEGGKSTETADRG